MSENKHHWYDGKFYDKIIAPNQDSLFSLIKSYIQPGSKILDVGCGTGRLGFFLQDKVSGYTGIDLSIRNIEQAKNNLSKTPKSKISFQHTDVNNFFSDDKPVYDYAVLTYVVHEIDEKERVKIIKLLSMHSREIIIGDYLIPRPKNFWSLLNGIIEFIAGKDHYKNFKNFEANGGLLTLAKNSGLHVIKEIKNTPNTSHFVVLSKNLS